MNVEKVVLVHGLYLPGVYMMSLQRRVGRCGFHVLRFDYPSVRRTVEQNAAGLQGLLQRIDADVVHLVGHSLGGLVVRQLFHDYPDQRPGRVVTLGTPHGGSYVARQLSRWAVGRLLLGHSLDPLLGRVPPWEGARDMGVIAGTVGMGLGWVVRGLPRPNDGTVAAEETRLPGMSDYIELPVSHTAMVFSSRVARQVCAFLCAGAFAHG